MPILPLGKRTCEGNRCRKAPLQKWYCKQVAVHGLNSEKCFVKDMEYCYCASMGFRFGWYEEGLQKYEQWYERGWCWADDKYYDPYATLINPHFIDRLPEFKYSAYKLYKGCNIFKYLRLYRQYPQLEMLMKLGFTRIAMSTTILKRCGTDKAFCKWLIANQPLLQERHYYIDVIVRAYRTKNRSTYCNHTRKQSSNSFTTTTSNR